MAISFRSQYDKRGYLKAAVARRLGSFGKDGRLSGSDRARLKRIEGLAEPAAALDDGQLRARVEEMRLAVQSGEVEIDDCVEEGFALAREASRRVTT